MPKTLEFTRNNEELEAIAKAIKSDKRPEVRQRAMGLRLLHEGHSPQEVAELSSVSAPTVYNWHHRFRDGGIEGLANRRKPGRPPKADEAYVELLEKVIEWASPEKVDSKLSKKYTLKRRFTDEQKAEKTQLHRRVQTGSHSAV
jgi:transposase